MRVVKPYVSIINPINYQEILYHIEKCGRTCYQSLSEPGIAASERFIKKLINTGHESVLEHFSISVKFVGSRSFTHEMVRHRLGAYSQESTRYCSYNKDKFGNQITVIEPSYFNSETEYTIWYETCLAAEQGYFALLAAGANAQKARTVLPQSTKSELVVTNNLRQWRHVLRTRTTLVCHPEMRELAIPLLALFKEQLPVFFEDIIIKGS